MLVWTLKAGARALKTVEGKGVGIAGGGVIEEGGGTGEEMVVWEVGEEGRAGERWSPG